MLEVHTFIYYGSIITKEDYENLTEKHGMMDLYQRVYSTGLTLKDVGEIGTTLTYVIGKELNWEMTPVTNLSYENNEFIIDDIKEKIKIDNEDEVRSKLLQIGITNPPKYCIVTCWGEMRGKE